MMKVFAVYDSAVKAFCRPFNMLTTGEAIRGWSDVVNDEKTEFFRHPDDYCLFQIAEYDETLGRYTNLSAPESLGSALKFKKSVELK